MARAPRPSQIDAYLPLIRETLEKFPTLTASRLFAMVYERGYRGSPDHFRHLIALHRPRRPAEAYLRLRSLPGEQAQVDWGHFGHLQIGRARRPLMAFVMVLSHSRQIFLRFFLDARMESFLRGHVGAFTAWGGVPRVLLYDNLKSAVLERRGDAIRFHPTPARLCRAISLRAAAGRGGARQREGPGGAGHRLCADGVLRRAQLQRSRRSQCPGRRLVPRPAADRRCPGEPDRTVRAVFADEAPRLLPLPDNPAPLLERVAVKVGKTPYVRFDLNDYSVPHTHVLRVLTVLADTHEVRIVDGVHVLACHPRSYDKGAQVELAGHVEALVAHKRAARQHRATDRLAQVAPASQELLLRAAERGANLGAITTGLMRLLDRYGAAELQIAIREALDRGVPHPNAVRLALERRREQRGEPPPVAVVLPAAVQARDKPVRPHALDTYDRLKDAADE